MAELLKKEREFVIPGEEIIRSIEHLPGRNCFREGESIFARSIGIVSVSGRVISVIPLNGVYMPKSGDMTIARVIEIRSNGWLLDINCPHEAFMSLSGVRGYIDTAKTELSSVYDIGDRLYCKIASAHGDSIHVTMQTPVARKLVGGRVIKINPAKVPRLIGKQGSMVSMIKERTGSRISIGQNGFVWFDEGDTKLVTKAVNMIESEAHKSGLTSKISKLLGGESVKLENDGKEKGGENDKERRQEE